MGIKDFTKVFLPEREIKYKDLKNKHIVIDARAEIYRGALSMKKMSDDLVDSHGRPTTHINTILLGVILKLKAAGAYQYWIFDYDQKRKEGEAFHVQLKELEILKRQALRKEAKEKVKKLKEELKEKDELFSSDDEEIKICHSEISKHEKRAFCLERFYTDDTIFMLNMLDIPWLIAPYGYEAEQICAMSTYIPLIKNKKMDYVLTPDADAIPFGAMRVIKRNIHKKKLFEYDLEKLLNTHDISLDDLIKISIILGWEQIPKTPRIGPKTVIAKYKNIELTEKQLEAYEFFHKKLTPDEKKSIIIYNIENEAFSNKNKYEQLLDWLELEKNYNRPRIVKQFQKLNLFE